MKPFFTIKDAEYPVGSGFVISLTSANEKVQSLFDRLRVLEESQCASFDDKYKTCEVENGELAKENKRLKTQNDLLRANSEELNTARDRVGNLNHECKKTLQAKNKEIEILITHNEYLETRLRRVNEFLEKIREDINNLGVDRRE